MGYSDETNEKDVMVYTLKEPCIMAWSWLLGLSSCTCYRGAYVGSLRNNPRKFIVDNDLLTADPYLSDDDGVQVKDIEGIPTGNLNKYILHADDPSYDEIPAVVRTINRRTVVSCDAWPGVKPEACMRLYGAQLLPILLRLIEKDVSEIRLDSADYYERAIHRQLSPSTRSTFL